MFSSAETKSLLEVIDLQTHFLGEKGPVPVVNGVSFQLEKGKTLCLVGESGCGKTVTALSIMRLILFPPGRVVGGKILFEDGDLLQKSEMEMRKVRGKEISMIFQEPMTSLNPVFTIGDQISEAIRLHQGVKKKEAMVRAIEMLNLVGIPVPAQRVREYPHQLSGGMRQRAMIAMALSCHPKVLIADEPTTALDVTIQAQILDLMKRLQKELKTSIILITHDLGIVAEMADEVLVMYTGQIVEKGDTASLLNHPMHPYTQGLLRSIPRLNMPRREPLHVIPGAVPNMDILLVGCHFHSRCPQAVEICGKRKPELREVGRCHISRCWLQ